MIRDPDQAATEAAAKRAEPAPGEGNQKPESVIRVSFDTIRLTAVICLAHILSMVGVFAFAALLPDFVAEWGLSKTDAGWLAGIHAAGYVCAAPFVVTLTDRIDARLIHMAGTATAALAGLGFAVLAEGFWSGLLFRALAGAGLAATYMPGLRVLVDRYQGGGQPRAIALYTASFSLGTALSFLLSGEIGAALGWRWAVGAGAAAALAALALVAATIRALPAGTLSAAPTVSLFDFRPVIANRRAMAYVAAYGLHSWELFTLRAWAVGLLAFALIGGGGAGWIAPTHVATVSAIAAWAASLLGQELAMKFGRPRLIVATMLVCAAWAPVVGLSAGWGYGAAALAVIAYAVLIQIDSAALTAGTVAESEPTRRGATLALHTMTSFAGAFIGPLVLGVILDVTGGGASAGSWFAALLSLSLVSGLGPLALRRGHPPGESRSNMS